MRCFFQLHLGCGADLENGNAARQLGKTLLQLLAVVIGIGVLDLGLDLRDATLEVILASSATDDGGLVLGDDDLLGLAEQRQIDVFELETDLFGDCGAHQSLGP